MEYGVMTARRGWAEAKDILNTRPLGDLTRWLQKKHSKGRKELVAVGRDTSHKESSADHKRAEKATPRAVARSSRLSTLHDRRVPGPVRLWLSSRTKRKSPVRRSQWLALTAQRCRPERSEGSPARQIMTSPCACRQRTCQHARSGTPWFRSLQPRRPEIEEFRPKHLINRLHVNRNGPRLPGLRRLDR